jgi:nicotinamidase-related amidase
MDLLDAERSIVLVIDLQGKLMELIDQPGVVITATSRLIRMAELFGVPVLLTEQYPRGLGTTHPLVRGAFDASASPKKYLAKTSFGCCGDSGFEAAMAALKPGLKAADRQIVVAGIEAHVCVMQTAVELLKQNSQVHVCWDCVSGRGAEYRRQALNRMAQAGAVITNHESVGFEWARDKDNPQFKALSSLLKEGSALKENFQCPTTNVHLRIPWTF